MNLGAGMMSVLGRESSREEIVELRAKYRVTPLQGYRVTELLDYRALEILS
jgi:hypothetical protein